MGIAECRVEPYIGHQCFDCCYFFNCIKFDTYICINMYIYLYITTYIYMYGK